MKLPPLFALVALSAAASLTAAEEKPAVSFRALTFDAACAAARQEGKLVFVDFYTTWCEPCKRLDKDTWTNAAVGRLVGEKAVPLKLDAEKEGRAAAQRYKINAYPTLLLVKPDGTELDRIVGYREPARFIEEFSAGVAGRNALARAADAVAAVPAAGREAVQARYNLAKTLTQSGKDAEALQHYLWCYDEGMLQDSSFAGVRTTFLTSDLGRLARRYPPARDAVVQRRDDARTRVLAAADDRRAALEFGALNEALGDATATLALFDQLPAGDLRRRGLGLQLFRPLVAKQRYVDALEALPYESMARLIDMTLGRTIEGTATAVAASKTYSIKTAATYVEALAGAGDVGHARDVIAKILGIDSSEETKSILRESLARAKHSELLDAPAPKP